MTTLSPPQYAFRAFLLLSVLCTAMFLESGEGASNGGPSVTVPDNTIVFVGDTQRTGFWERILLREQNDEERIAVMQEIARERPALIVHLGDVVDQGDNTRSWEQFDHLIAPAREASIPMVAVPGNHDYFGDRDLALRNFFQRFPHVGGRTWSSVREDSIGIILLNSNFGEMSDSERAEQESWYRAELDILQNDPGLVAVIVCCHHAPYTNSTVVSDNDDVQKRFVSTFLAIPKAVIFFAGHCHSYEHFVQGGKHFVVSGGGGGPRQRLSSNRDASRHKDLYDGGMLRRFNFCKLSLHSGLVTVQVMMLDPEKDAAWSVGDTWGVQAP